MKTENKGFKPYGLMKKSLICVLIAVVLLTTSFTGNAAEIDISNSGSSNTEFWTWQTSYTFPYVEFESTAYNSNTITQYIRWKVHGVERWYNNISKFRIFWRTPSSGWNKYKDISVNSYTNNKWVWYNVPVVLTGNDFSKYGGVYSDSSIKTFFTVRAMNKQGEYISDYARNTYTTLAHGDAVAPKMVPYSVNGNRHTWKVNIRNIKGWQNASKIRFFYRNSKGNWIRLGDMGVWNYDTFYYTLNANDICYRVPNNYHYQVTCRLVDIWGNYCSAYLYGAIGNKPYTSNYWTISCD